jgi:heptosyltransferase III
MKRQKDTILIFRIGSLGDTLVALPAFHLIRQQYPTSRIVLLTNIPKKGMAKEAPSHQILMGSGLVDDYIAYPHKTAGIRDLVKLARAIRELQPSATFYLVDFRNRKQRLRDAVFFAAAGTWRVRGLWPGRDGDVHLPVKDNAPEWRESEASRLLRSIGFDPKVLSRDLFSLRIQSHERDSAASLLRDYGMLSKPFIALSVGAKVPAKDWGQDRWLEFLGLLGQARGGFHLLLFGSADERERCQQLLEAWPNGGINLCGQLSPRQSAAVLERAAVFVGHDSGPMHLANSVGITCVSIFAAREKPGIWFPYGNEEHVFYNRIRAIRPCDVAERVQALLMAKNPDVYSSLQEDSDSNELA